MPRVVQARTLATLERIFAATEALIGHQGVGSLTLEAVASEAGISKGGVLHHFRSKDALIAALVSRRLAAMRADTEAEEAKVAAGHRALLGLLRHCARQYAERGGFSAALLLAATANAACRDEIQGALAAKIAAIRAENARPDEADVLVFAALGLLLSRTLGLSTLSDPEAAAMFAAAERMGGGGP